MSRTSSISAHSMADNFLNCRDKLSYHIQNTTSYNAFSSSQQPQTFLVTITFFYEQITINELLIDDNIRSWPERHQPVTVCSVSLNFLDVSELPGARGTIRRTLSSWLLSDDELENLVAYTEQNTMNCVNFFRSLGHNIINLELQVTQEHSHIVVSREDIVMGPIMQPSMEESGPGMVPATDESIKSCLKRGVATDGIFENCVICMEEVSDAVSMPCEHAFHGGCIEEWLRNSHYCPICRFELPKS